jgi:uncharacterized SAM-binding protein YcdF (DUF218 family)
MYVSLALYVGRKASQDTTKKSDVILVLGARSYIKGEYNPCLVSRVAHAVDLYEKGIASKIIMSGGDDTEDGVNEAETMKKIAVEKGVDGADIVLEKKATSTYENFRLSKKILEEIGSQSVIIVTEPFHIARASLVAKKAGYDFTVSPAGRSPCWQRYSYFSRYFLKEPIAILTYKLQNKL